MKTQILVHVWLALLGTCHSVVPRNLALWGRATQSTIASNQLSGLAHAYNAVDGNKDSDFYDGTCSQTSQQDNPWWRLDLLDIFVVTSVIVTNRDDRYSSRLSGAEIRIGNSLQRNGVENPLAGRSLIFGRNQEFPGRYVVVYLPGKDRILSLCEVEVYGYLIPSSKSIAITGKATQSTLYGNAIANNAIDGNKDAVFADGSCSSTNGNPNDWWRVDLLKTYKVFSVAITNRADCCTERINGAEIRIGDSLDNAGNNNPRCAVVSTIRAGATETYQCQGMEGRYVNVYVPGRSEYLTLCEVEVFGAPLE